MITPFLGLIYSLNNIENSLKIKSFLIGASFTPLLSLNNLHKPTGYDLEACNSFLNSQLFQYQSMKLLVNFPSIKEKSYQGSKVVFIILYRRKKFKVTSAFSTG